MHFIGVCSGQFSSHIGQNLQAILPDIKNELDCKDACSVDTGCKFYTYNTANDTLFPGTCFLLSSLLEPVLPCHDCRTGSADCFAKDNCFFLTDEGNITTEMMITDTSKQTMVTFPSAVIGVPSLR